MADFPAEITGGVDTHKHAHMAAAVDSAGRLLATAAFAADASGYQQMLGWLESQGTVACVGVEGTGSYGARLARYLQAAGVKTVEVNRPNRQFRRRRGKTDAVDAEAAARAALSGQADAVPKAANGPVEAIRMLQAARRSAVKARTQAANQIHNIAVTAPEPIRDRLAGLRGRHIIEACAQMRPSAAADPATAAADPATAAAKTALRLLARRHRALGAEIAQLDEELLGLCQQANPALLGARGVGAEVAAVLLAAAGDNPERMRTEPAFAALCGASPIQASSGQTTRHRLNRSGNRQANNALWRIAITRLRTDPRTIAYAQRRRAEGKTSKEIVRCLKRYIAREIYWILTDPPPTPQGADLRRQRQRQGLTIAATAHTLNVAPTRISALERGKYHNSDLAHRYQQHLTKTPA